MLPDFIYQGRKGGGELIVIEECVKRESKSLNGYSRDSTEWMLQIVLKEKVLFEEDQNLQDYQRRRKEEKVRNWKEKALHGEFVQQT